MAPGEIDVFDMVSVWGCTLWFIWLFL